MAQTKAPSGLTIKRNNNVFTASWKIGDVSYGQGQQAQYRIGSKPWTSISCGKNDTSKSFAIPMAQYKPQGSGALGTVWFRVRGNRPAYIQSGKRIDPSMSGWATKYFSIEKTDIPKLTATAGDYPRMTYSWSVPNSSASSAKWCVSCEYTSVLLQDSEVTDGSKVDWNSTVGTRHYSKTASPTGTLNINEDTAQLNDGHSYTRWFRIRSWSTLGPSAWTYSRKVYAMPNQATVTKTQIGQADRYGSNTNIQVWYSIPRSYSRPISSIVTEYAIAKPTATMECPAGASWTEGSTSIPKNPTDVTGGAIFDANVSLSSDECLFVRVNVVYDGKTTYGVPVLADKGKLANPSGLSVSYGDNYMATVTATNNSEVSGSALQVYFISNKYPDGIIIGHMMSGETSKTVQCPEYQSTANIRIGVKAVVGSDDDPDMVSELVTAGGSVPEPVRNFTAVSDGDVIKTNWQWDASEDVVGVELSWSDYDGAWQSTEEPATYEVSRLKAPAWNVSGLETGKVWYIRARNVMGYGDNQTYGAYTDSIPVRLSSAPSKPSLNLSKSIINVDDDFTATWTYTTTDGTPQVSAEIAEVTYSQGEAIYTKIAEAGSSQQISLNARRLGWNNGDHHALAVRVSSESGRLSEWSKEITIDVVEPLTCEITNTTLEYVTITSEDEEGEPVTRLALSLTEMPLAVRVRGAGTEGQTSLVVERAESYNVAKPDESTQIGYEGDTVYIKRQTGEDVFTIYKEDLIGALDDEASYRLVATVKDAYGQSAEAILEFEVHWTHQAIMPEATVEIDTENGIAKITPTEPSGALTGDYCNIYRLSTDKPELVYQGAAFGTTYVDPYPAIGDAGGYRVVYLTDNGDYITADHRFAWLDIDEKYQTNANIIEWNGGKVELKYNLDLDTGFDKGFKETQYLGGAVQGDWTAAVSRTGSLNGETIATRDPETIMAMRRLASYPGVCHVRTLDGSSYAADVQVQEKYSTSSANKVASFTLKITRIDPQDLDGMTLEDWQSVHDED